MCEFGRVRRVTNLPGGQVRALRPVAVNRIRSNSLVSPAGNPQWADPCSPVVVCTME